jgi:RNA-directed DNA polymerase
MGNQTSQCFALYYLDGIDRILKEKFHLRWYCRYMDDGIAISGEKSLLEEALKSIVGKLYKNGLTLNNKTKINGVCTGFKFLGLSYSYFGKGAIKVKLDHNSRSRIKDKLSKSNLPFYKSYFANFSEHRFLIATCSGKGLWILRKFNIRFLG